MRRRQQTFLGGTTTIEGSPFFTGADEYGRTEDEREEGETFGLMTRVNGRGRLIPTPAPDLDSKLWWRGA